MNGGDAFLAPTPITWLRTKNFGFSREAMKLCYTSSTSSLSSPGWHWVGYAYEAPTCEPITFIVWLQQMCRELDVGQRSGIVNEHCTHNKKHNNRKLLHRQQIGSRTNITLSVAGWNHPQQLEGDCAIDVSSSVIVLAPVTEDIAMGQYITCYKAVELLKRSQLSTLDRSTPGYKDGDTGMTTACSEWFHTQSIVHKTITCSCVCWRVWRWDSLIINDDVGPATFFWIFWV